MRIQVRMHALGQEEHLHDLLGPRLLSRAVGGAGGYGELVVITRLVGGVTGIGHLGVGLPEPRGRDGRIVPPALHVGAVCGHIAVCHHIGVGAGVAVAAHGVYDLAILRDDKAHGGTDRTLRCDGLRREHIPLLHRMVVDRDVQAGHIEHRVHAVDGDLHANRPLGQLHGMRAAVNGHALNLGKSLARISEHASRVLPGLGCLAVAVLPVRGGRYGDALVAVLVASELAHLPVVEERVVEVVDDLHGGVVTISTTCKRRDVVGEVGASVGHHGAVDDLGVVGVRLARTEHGARVLEIVVVGVHGETALGLRGHLGLRVVGVGADELGRNHCLGAVVDLAREAHGDLRLVVGVPHGQVRLHGNGDDAVLLAVAHR